MSCSAAWDSVCETFPDSEETELPRSNRGLKAVWFRIGRLKPEPHRLEVVQFLSCCPAGVYFTLPVGESSLGEERATAPSPPLAHARPFRKREGKCLADNDLKTARSPWERCMPIKMFLPGNCVLRVSGIATTR